MLRDDEKNEVLRVKTFPLNFIFIENYCTVEATGCFNLFHCKHLQRLNDHRNIVMNGCKSINQIRRAVSCEF